MKLLLLFGNTAVGKMTVGQALTKLTPFRLFHNHMMIEPVLEVFGDFHYQAISRLREVIFQEFVKTGHYGLIFTFMWAFDCPADWEYVERMKRSLGLSEEDVYYVELIAPQAVRLERNATENRLKHKPSKRDLESSNRRLIHDDLYYRCESLPGEIPSPNYLRLQNENLSPEDAARAIKNHFGFPDL